MRLFLVLLKNEVELFCIFKPLAVYLIEQKTYANSVKIFNKIILYIGKMIAPEKC